MRTILLILTLLVLCVVGAQAVTIDSPFVPVKATSNLSLAAPPPIPANGLVLGWAGGSGEVTRKLAAAADIARRSDGLGGEVAGFVAQVRAA